MVMFLALHPMESYISQLIRFARASSHVADFTDDTIFRYLNSKLDLNLSCAKDFGNLNSMVTWCIYTEGL